MRIFRVISRMILVYILVCGSGFADTLLVPSEYASIQLAIDEANDGDTVLVSPGTYFENLDFLGKAIVVISSDGPEDTVIDGGKINTVVRFVNREELSSTIEGFTLTNGFSYKEGGGIYCEKSSPTIRGNIIDRNPNSSSGKGMNSGFLGSDGAGIYCIDSDALIENNAITNNSSGGGGSIHCEYSLLSIIGNTISNNYGAGYGGGISGDFSFLIIIDNVITHNEAHFEGGGIYGWYSSAIIENNQIDNNTARINGGGIFFREDFPASIVRNNTIRNNKASGTGSYSGGGGIYLFSSDSTIISHNLISGNYTPARGGAIHCRYSGNPLISNNLIHDNNAVAAGGAIYCISGSSPMIVNNTIVFNHTDLQYGYGGALFCDSYSDAVVRNSILWGNTAFGGEAICIANIDRKPSIVTVEHSDVEGGQHAVFVMTNSKLVWRDGNLDEDPLFDDPGADDYHLHWLSPCINRGTNTGAPSQDLDGDPRPFMGTVDMGYDEFVDTHALAADLFTVSVTGGSIHFALDGGAANAGRVYLILGSQTGTVPGSPLPGGLVTLPLAWDSFTNYMLGHLNGSVFTDFLGALDVHGQGTAQLNVPVMNPAYIGTKMYYTYPLEGNPAWNFVSNPVIIEFVP